MELKGLIETAGELIDAAGVVVIVGGALTATAMFGHRLTHGAPFPATYRRYRQGLGRAILLGLEFLVAGDIVRSVAVSPTFAGVGVLAMIVLIRTFLSASLEVELEGRWPWRRARDDVPPEAV
ncbi:DUF1622 domain-containing protein [Sphaerisporangium rubeum]|uniref:Putative membrane protein n=1 Tax=Sphaerisporangium rubeum TaxID=321317 RepID=A0A7X0IJL3_9ACTN|nr:putative membrane protein [Sphaerisporangium rubeum]